MQLRPDTRAAHHVRSDNTASARRRQRQGFSLPELMTTVAIVGVLGAVAMPTFSDYIYKSRTAEATEFLGVIRLREESYRAEFGQYCHTMSTATSTDLNSLNDPANLLLNPTTTRRDAKPWPTTLPVPWLRLGARPTGPMRFGYGVVAGGPDTAAATGLGFDGSSADFWFVAQAVGDLDGDNSFVTFQVLSATKGIGVSVGGTPSDKGWE